MRRVQKVLVLIAVLATALASAGPAGADPPSTDVFDVTTVDCHFDTGSGFAELHIGMETYGEGSGGWVDVLVGTEDDFLYSDWGYSFEFSESDFSADVALISETHGEVVGAAAIAGTYEQAGDLELLDEWRSKFGNVWEEGRFFYAPVAVAGALEIAVEGLEPMTFDLAGCEGARNVEEIWHTNPQAQVFKGTDTHFFCELESDGWFAGLFAYAGNDGGWLDLQAFGPEGEYYGFLDDPDLGLGNIYLEVDLWEPMEEDPTALAVIDANLTKGALFDVDFIYMDGYDKVEEYELIVEGELTLPHDVVFDLSACEGRHAELRFFFNDNESNAKGQPPINDLPADAVELRNRDSVHTRMAAEEPEASCIDPDWGETPMGKTVWYTVEGTGDAMTIDTAGSDFDTVVSVFLMEEDTMIPVACQDDVWDDRHYTSLAALTWDTAADEVYYVQIGGFAAEYGHLKVAVF